MSTASKVFDAMVSELTELGKSDLGKDVFQHLVAELELYGEVERRWNSMVQSQSYMQWESNNLLP